MGVAGSGKTTIGRLLAEKFGWPYFEADDFHSATNKEKMEHGVPLDDSDRAPWLAAIRRQIDQCIAQHQSAVFTCSALKEKYRQTLTENAPSVKLVYLSGPPALLQARLAGREAHYMKANMLESQLAALEVPGNALKIDIDQSPEKIVEDICHGCGV
jgi:gluconokinase